MRYLLNGFYGVMILKCPRLSLWNFVIQSHKREVSTDLKEKKD